jgi:hypothetical protein
MRTNGLVGWVGFALAASLANVGFAQEAFQLFARHEGSGTVAAASAISDLESAEVLVADDYGCEDDIHCGRCPHWFGGVEASFLNIIATTGGQITLSFNDNTTVGTEISFLDGNGMDGVFGVAPRVWFGRQFGEKWGVAGRFWTLNQAFAGRPDLVPGTTPLPTFGTYDSSDRLDMHNVAIEVIRSFEPGAWKIDAIGGVCQANIEVQSQIHAFGVITTGNFANLLLSNGCNFDGAGLVGGVAARRQFGNSPFSFYTSARGSHLWGHSDSFGRSAGAIASSPSAPLVGAATVTRNNAEATMDIFELQLGGQWDFELRRLPMNAFFRAAFEYQYWHIDGPPTGGAGFGGTIGDLTTNSFSRASLGDASLVGATLGAGLTW